MAERGLRVGRFASGVLLAGACLLAAACARETPRQAALSDEIAVGPYTFQVVGARDSPNPPPPISTFRNEPGKKGIVVFVRWNPSQHDLAVMDRLALIENFLEAQLSIVNSAGQRTPVFQAIPEKLMYMQDPGGNWWDWIVVAYVPDQSRDLTLLVENPEPREGQSRLTAVPLGM